MKTVMFACVHNAGRSQMAAAWFNALADPTGARAISAGTEPGARVHPEVLEAMKRGRHRSLERPAEDAHARARGQVATCWSRWAAARSARSFPGLRARRLAARGSEGQAGRAGARDSRRGPRRIEDLIAKEGWGEARPAAGAR